MRPSLIGPPGSAVYVTSCDSSTTAGKPVVDKHAPIQALPIVPSLLKELCHEIQPN